MVKNDGCKMGQMRDAVGKCVPEPKPGDYVRVISSDDPGLIKVGSFGVIEGRDTFSEPEEDRLSVVFNFYYPPFRNIIESENREFVSASGGPVRGIKKSSLIGTSETKTVQEHDLIHDRLRADMPSVERTIRVYQVVLPEGSPIFPESKINAKDTFRNGEFHSTW